MQPVRTLSFRLVGRLPSGGVADIKDSSHNGLCNDAHTGSSMTCRYHRRIEMTRGIGELRLCMSFVVKPVRILNSCLGMLLFVVEACRYNRLQRADSSRRLALLIHLASAPSRLCMKRALAKPLGMLLCDFCDAFVHRTDTVTHDMV